MNIFYYPDQLPDPFANDAARGSFAAEVVDAVSYNDLLDAVDPCLRLLKRYIPADTFCISVWGKGNKYYTQFVVDEHQAPMSRLLEYKNPKDVVDHWFSVPDTFIHIFHDDAPITGRDICRNLIDDPPWSIMFYRMLLPETQFIVHLIVLARGHGRYDKREAACFLAFGFSATKLFEHVAEYFRIKKEPKTPARSNKPLRYKPRQGIVSLADLPGMHGVYQQVMQVAELDTPVLILGETGVGKELVADTIHELSHRARAPLVKVNCGAIPEQLVDSELFGHEKGAFTSAVESRKGRFERAHTGTLLLDEVGELPLGTQARLLRVLQSGEMDRVGGRQTISVDTRILACSNVDLARETLGGKFRSDLFYRMNVFPVHIPPLRRRVGDIPILVEAMLRQMALDRRRPMPTVPAEDLEQLLRYTWPGNVRELKNTVERAFILWRLNTKYPFRLRLPIEALRQECQPVAQESFETFETFMTLAESTLRHIKAALRLSGGKIEGQKGAAKLLGLNPSTLRSKLRVLGLPLPWDNK